MGTTRRWRTSLDISRKSIFASSKNQLS